ncbi:amidohydrolase family protein [Streptomyces sp. SA15]|uniref:amidohydrolase family protein n=1 Tax=Streptomyces sp. SA15 TaxID=934019 RepID=UPI0015CBABC0|nr:amidohydrolase family protein [Streptomyces sp. SA15]
MRSELLALRAGHVFDGVDVRQSGMVLVEDGVIRDVDFTGAAAPQHAAVTDFGPDGWLLPGLIDAHVHLCWDGSKDAVEHVSSDSHEAVLETARASAAATLATGVTTVRDLGDRDYLTLALREQVPPTERPDIVAAGPSDVDKDTRIAYTDQLYAQLKQRQPGLKHIRLGCTGETTASLLKGDTCHYPNAKSQLDAAAKAMAKHRGHVSYVTIDIGANDILECADDTTGAIDQTCVNRAGQAIPTNLAQITRAPPGGYPRHPVRGRDVLQPVPGAMAPRRGRAADRPALGIPLQVREGAISQVYAAAGFKVADVAGAFSSGDVTPVSVPSYGEIPANVAKICQLTWACTMQDPHPNPLGHKVIASTFAAVLPQSGVPQQKFVVQYALPKGVTSQTYARTLG